MLGLEWGYGSFADPSAARLRENSLQKPYNREGHPSKTQAKQQVASVFVVKHYGFEHFFLEENPSFIFVFVWSWARGE